MPAYFGFFRSHAFCTFCASFLVPTLRGNKNNENENKFRTRKREKITGYLQKTRQGVPTLTTGKSTQRRFLLFSFYSPCLYLA